MLDRRDWQRTDADVPPMRAGFDGVQPVLRPFTPERSAPGRFHPRRTAPVQKRTAAALYAFCDLSQPIRTASAEAQWRRAQNQ